MSAIASLIGIIIIVLALYIFVKKVKLVLILAILVIFYLAYHFIIPSIQTGGIQNIFSIGQNIMNLTYLLI